MSGTGAKVECIFENMHEDSFPWHKVISGCQRTLCHLKAAWSS